MDLKETVEMCKAGQAQEAYAANRKELDANPEDRYARVGLAYSIKALLGEAARGLNDEEFVRLLDEYGSLRLSEIDESEMNAKVAWDIRAMLLAWKDAGAVDFAKVDRLAKSAKGIDYPKPHRYYSVLLDAFLKARDARGAIWPGIAEFAAWWGLDNLLAEDYERVLMTNGQRMPSLAERIYTACLKALVEKVGDGESLEAAEKFLGDLEVLEETHPEYSAILYQKSNLLKAMGRMDEALETARSYVRKRSTEFRAWSALGDIVDDEQEKLACYCRALGCKMDPMYQGKVRYKLAISMYRLGFLSEAKREFSKIRQIYESKGWHIPPGVEAIEQQEWYRNTYASESNHDFYVRHGREADDLLYAEVAETPVLISTYNPQKQMATYVTPDRKRGYFSTKKTTYKFIPNNIYLIKFDGVAEEGAPSKLLRFRKPEDVTPYEGTLFRKTEGEVGLRPGQSFLFVDDVYVDGMLMRNYAPGTLAEITSVLYYNLKRDSWGWRAVRVKPV